MNNQNQSIVDVAQRQLNPTQQLALLACFKPTLTLEEAAAYSGLSLSHLYKLTSTNRIPHYKPAGKIIYFDRSELDDWLKRNRVKTTDEIESVVLAKLTSGDNRKAA